MHTWTKNVERKLSNGLLIFFNLIRHGITLFQFSKKRQTFEKIPQIVYNVKLEAGHKINETLFLNKNDEVIHKNMHSRLCNEL